MTTGICDGKTLFLKDLPKTTSADLLEKLMSDFGPVKKCFIVTDKETGLSRGFGYVKFSLREDASKALEAAKHLLIDDCRIHAAYALSKKYKKAKKKSKEDVRVRRKHNIKPLKAGHLTDVSKIVCNKNVNLESTCEGNARTLIIHSRNFIPRRTLKNKLMKFGKIKKVVYQKSDDFKLRVLFESRKSAQTVLKKLASCKVKGQEVVAFLKSRYLKALQILEKKRFNKNARIIIRNLSFQCTEVELKDFFSKFGMVLQVEYPQKDGKPRGFAFIQFLKEKEAQLAIKKVNGSFIKDRPVAADWALAKDKFLREINTLAENHCSDNGVEENVVIDSADPALKIESSEETKGTIESESSSEGDLSDLEDLEDLEENPYPQINDVSEGRTVFIRNLPFSASNEDLFKCFEKFGKILYARVVVDPATGKSKGSAFVKFQDETSVKRCLEAAMCAVVIGKATEGGITLLGRSLLVTLAVDRNKASKFSQESNLNKKPKKIKDLRNLYLAKEGYIEPGSKASLGVSHSDLAKRRKSQLEINLKLKNPSFMVSKTRLSVRNIPLHVDEVQLRKIFNEAGRTESCVRPVKKVLLFRNRERLGKDNRPRSLGYCFIEFKQHDSALKALRHLNNNPEFFSPEKRLIVEFALENLNKTKNKSDSLQPKKRKKKSLGERFQAKRRAKARGDCVKKELNCKQTTAQKSIRSDKGALLPSVPAKDLTRKKPVMKKMIDQEAHFSRLVGKYKKLLFGEQKELQSIREKRRKWYEV
ncbi:RNA-binding protein 28-like isoform X3 [Zophobas morio]|uniref:RNA-binding protein 28-like isoform X3 n=1 Tax=Zophobas morio TaxID=2755281 RepID=UPI0030834843